MKKKTLFIAALCCSLFSFSPLMAKNYYVSKSGSDTNPGTKSHPFLTISKASSVLKAGDKCIIKSGTYHEVITPAVSGTSSRPIIYTAYKNDKVVISGVETVNGWTLYKDNIYQAKCIFPMNIEAAKRMVFADNKAMDIARWPNNEDHDPYTLDARFVEEGSDSTMMKCASIPDFDWAGGKMAYLGAHSGVTWARPILSSSNGVVRYEPISIQDWPFSSHNPKRKEGKNKDGKRHRGQLYLYDKLEALDYPGEWYYDTKKHKVYIMTLDKKRPTNSQISYVARENTVDATKKKHIHFDGLDFFGGRVVLGAYNKLENCLVSNASQRSHDLKAMKGSINDGSVIMTGDYTVLERNIIEYGATNGIYAGRRKHLTVQNNIIRYFNTVGVHCCPVRMLGCDYCKLLNNTIHTSGRDVVTLVGLHNETAYNDISRAGLINNDGACFYVVGNKELKHSSVHHNWVHDSQGPWYTDGRIAGIYLDNDSKGYDVYNNVIWNISWPGIYFNWDNWHIKIYNNTIFNTGGFLGRWEHKHCLKDVVVKNNLSEGNLAPAKREPTKWDNMDYNTTTNRNIVAMNPINECLVDKDNYGFMPKKDGPLVDAGVYIKGFTKKYKGKAPDVGAYEYGKKPWKAGTTWKEADFRK